MTTPEQRQRAIEQGLDPDDPASFPESQVALQELRQESDEQSDLLRKSINRYYDQQQEDVSGRESQVLKNALEQIRQQGLITETQQRFARAKSGNVGGSRKATQQGLLQRALGMQAAQATGRSQATEAQASQEIESQRLEDVLGTFDNPFEQAATNALLRSYGQQTQGIQRQTQGQMNLNRIYSEYQSQIGQWIGGTIRNIGDAYHTSYLVNQ